MSRIKQVLQHDETDCEPACVSIILQYYGKTVPLRKIRAVVGTDKIGTLVLEFPKLAKLLGLIMKVSWHLRKKKFLKLFFLQYFILKQM